MAARSPEHCSRTSRASDSRFDSRRAVLPKRGTSWVPSYLVKGPVPLAPVAGPSLQAHVPNKGRQGGRRYVEALELSPRGPGRRFWALWASWALFDASHCLRRRKLEDI